MYVVRSAFLISCRNYQQALDLMRRATAMPSTKTDYYDEVSLWNMTSGVLYSCIHLLCYAFSSE